MKTNKLLIALLSIAMLSMVACNDKNAPTGPGQQNPNDSTAVVSVDTTGTYVTVAQALSIISELEPSKATDVKYKIVGEVIQNNTDPANVPGKYTNINITIKDATGSIACYYMNNLNNEAFTSSKQVPRVGSKVVMIGQLKNYVNKNTSATTPEMANGFILRIIEMQEDANPKEYTHVTIAQALEIGKDLAEGEETPGYYMDTVIITTVKTKAADVPGTYTNINMTVKDETGTMDSYYTNYLENAAFTSADQIPSVNSKVVIVAKIANYKGTIEFKNGYIAAILEEGVVEPRKPIEDYTYITIAEALEIGATLANDAETEGYYMDTVIITAVKTKAADVPGTYTNINMTVKDETGTLDCYYTYYLENAEFTSANQIPPVNSKVVIIAKIANYKGTTIEFKNGYIAAILEEGNGVVEPEIKGDVVFAPTAKQMPEGWTVLLDGTEKESTDKDFYADFAFKLDKLNKGVQSPEFDGGNAVKVSFMISKLNTKTNATEQTDGKIDIIALDAEGNEVASATVDGVNKVDTYSAELVSEEISIAYVQVILKQFPWNGSVQCNAALKEVAIDIISE